MSWSRHEDQHGDASEQTIARAQRYRWGAVRARAFVQRSDEELETNYLSRRVSHRRENPVDGFPFVETVNARTEIAAHQNVTGGCALTAVMVIIAEDRWLVSTASFVGGI